MACSIDLANPGLRFNPHPPTNTTPTSNQRRIRRRSLIAFPTSLDPKLPHHLIRRISCSAVDEEQIQKTDEISLSDDEKSLISTLIGIQGRGRSASPQQLQAVEQAVKVLEATEGVPDPVELNFADELEPDRGSVAIDLHNETWNRLPDPSYSSTHLSWSVFQEIYLRTNDPRVCNIVKFSDAIGELKVEAAATIKDRERILFRFDEAAFSLSFLPFKVPYPVPFRLLGDEAKGWLDTTYLSKSGNLRISRGNKGTTFVLQKQTEPRQRLLYAISSGRASSQAIDEFLSLNENATKGELELVEGEWQMIWSSQMETDSWIENAANGLMGTQIVKENGILKFRVDILLGFKFSMSGTFEKSGTNVYNVTMDDGAIVVGPYGLPVELITKFKLEVLYSDKKIRITRGYNNILFVHLRVDG